METCLAFRVPGRKKEGSIREREREREGERERLGDYV